MFRPYDYLQVENIFLARITQLTTDPLFYTIANIIVIVFYDQMYCLLVRDLQKTFIQRVNDREFVAVLSRKCVMFFFETPFYLQSVYIYIYIYIYIHSANWCEDRV
jgi:hypothetical protein